MWISYKNDSGIYLSCEICREYDTKIGERIMMRKICNKAVCLLMAVMFFTSVQIPSFAKAKELSINSKVGDSVYFGRYEQDGKKKNGKERIEWIVLDKKEDEVLLISKLILDVQPYDKDNNQELNWKDSSVREWLNEIFIDKAFDKNESKMLEETDIANNGKGQDTKDRVFLLSGKEAKKYLKSKPKRIGKLTVYAIRRMEEAWGADAGGSGYKKGKKWYWWLRTFDKSKKRAFSVLDDGTWDTVGSEGYIPSNGIRPAVWVDLDS